MDINNDQKLIGVDVAAEMLGVTRGTLYVWVCHKKIPYFKIGRLIKFGLSDIEKWIKKRRIKELH